MSVSHSSSFSILPKSTTENEKDQEKSSLNSEQQSDKKYANKEQEKTSTSGEKPRKKLAQLSPPKKFDQPVLRNKLSTRERSISSPLIIRPVGDQVDTSPPPGKTPDEKSFATNRKRKNADAATLPKSSDPSTTSQAQADTRLPSSTPKLRTKKPNPARKSLSPEQQLGNDLADLMDKQLLRKPGRADDEIAVNQMTASLQRYSGKPADAKVRIDELMLTMFSEDMKKSDAWEIARKTAVKIKTAYFFGRDETSTLEAKKEKESEDMLQILVASFAGAFFNVSGDEKNRLPEKLRLFLQAVDHRQIRSLLSADAGIKMSHEKFMQARKEWLAKALLDNFLIPLVLKEFFPARGTMESDKTAAYIIQSLHAALSVSVTDLLAESLKSPPDDIAELMLKRRTHHFEPRRDRKDDDTEKKSPTEKFNVARAKPSLSSHVSPERARREALNKLLKKIITQLKPNTLSPEMLQAIKALNRELAESEIRTTDESTIRLWLDIAKKIDAKSAVVSALQTLLDEEVEQSDLAKAMVEIDLLSKLADIESKGQPLVTDRARRLSSDLPFFSTPISTASTSTLSNQWKVPRSPGSPSNRQVQHKRSKTADVVMPMPENLTDISIFTTEERNALLKAYPDLLLECVKRSAMVKTEQGMKLNTDPFRAISIAGRDKFPISLDSFPAALRAKIVKATKSDDKALTVSHAELLKLLMLDSLKQSPAGKLFAAKRSETLRLFSPSLTAEKLNALPDQQAQQTRATMAKNIQVHVDSMLEEIFGNGLLAAGLPDDLINLWREFDHKLLSWVDQYPEIKKKIALWPVMHPELKEGAIDTLRSELEFDLIVTRLLYPVAIGIINDKPPVSSVRFGDAVRKSLKPLWDEELFNDFKAVQKADVVISASSASVSNTSQTPGTKQ